MTTGSGHATAPQAPPRASPPKIAPYQPLLVHLRVPRESAPSNDVESAPNRPPGASDSMLRSRRRPRDESSDDETLRDARGDGATSDSSSSVTTTREGAARKKPRKPTYVAQKEEKEALLRELQELKARTEALRARVGMPSLSVFEDTRRREEENRHMERARRSNLFSLSAVHSTVANYMREHFSGPLKITIKLGQDMALRRATMMGIRSEKLDLGRRYMATRMQGVNTRIAFDEKMSWTSEEGDFCFWRNDVSHFEGVQSVKQVFDALHFYIANMEITISEVLGQLTLREDIDCVGTQAMNHRIVSSTDHGIIVESNTVTFSEFTEEFAIITADSVDEDELYPYCPYERVRKDVHAVMTVSSFRKPTKDNSLGDLVVVLCRSAFLSFKRPQFPIAPAALEDMHGTVASWGRVMTNTIREQVYAQMPKRQPKV